MGKINIQNDMGLISVLGTGHEHSNHEALVCWLMSRYSLESFQNMAKILDTVSQDVYNFLEQSLNDGDFSC